MLPYNLISWLPLIYCELYTVYANILHTFTFCTFLISLPYCRSKCNTYPFNLFLKGDISSYSSLFLGHHQIWQPEKRADRHTDVTDILYLLKVVLLHGQQVTPGDIIFLCMCVCGKPKTEKITQHLPNQNFTTWSRCTCITLFHTVTESHLQLSKLVHINQIGPKNKTHPEFNSGQANPAHYIYYLVPSKICKLQDTFLQDTSLDVSVSIRQLCSFHCSSPITSIIYHTVSNNTPYLLNILQLLR